MPRPSLKLKPSNEYATKLDLKAEMTTAKSNIKALTTRLLVLSKEFEAARRSYARRAQSPRNLPMQKQFNTKAATAERSKKRCALVLHTVMHQTRAPGMSTDDWATLAPLFKGLKKSA